VWSFVCGVVLVVCCVVVFLSCVCVWRVCVCDLILFLQYILDGERACWPHLDVIRSLTDIEYTLDAVAAELQCAIRGKLPRHGELLSII